MTFQFDGFNHVISLKRGEFLVESLTQFAKDQQLKGGFISGLGACEWVELGYYNLDQQKYEWHKVDELLEITSLQGNVAWMDGEPVIHIHGTFADNKLQNIGGHVKELAVGGACEIFLHNWFGSELGRQKDGATGLNQLKL